MAKSSKGQEFLESYKDEAGQKIYDLVIQYKNKSEIEITRELLKDNGIKMIWQNADSETEKA